MANWRFCQKSRLAVLSEKWRASAVSGNFFYYFFEDFCLRPAIFVFTAIFLLEQSNLTATTCRLNFVHKICSYCRKLAVSKKIKKSPQNFVSGRLLVYKSSTKCCNKYASSNGSSNNTRNIRSHRIHQKEIRRIIFKSYFI